MISARVKPPTGRVIALGRVLLAVLYLTALLIDTNRPAIAPVETYALLAAYVVFAIGLTVVTWRNWWLDVMLAAPAHALDISLFTILVLATTGYASPYFTFFVFLLLSAAIRWGWRETALTAGLVTTLYLVAGLIVQLPTSASVSNPFVVRTGHLVILSAILIWFGVNQRADRRRALGSDLFGPPSLESPVETALRAATAATGAGRGVMTWFDHSNGRGEALVIEDGALSGEAAPTNPAPVAETRAPFLYDLRHDRGLEGDPQHILCVLKPSKRIDAGFAARFGLGEGIAIPIATATGSGMLFLERMPTLSTDSLQLGADLAADLADHFQRGVLIKALEQSSEASARLVVARDLHDSVVQFLAGATIRVEAMLRAGDAPDEVAADLQELKRLMLLEQRDLRHFIAALRSDAEINAVDLAEDLAELADKLAHQWGIHCTFGANLRDMTVPMRLRLDAHQLIREAVANAVRHGNADLVEINVAADLLGGTLALELRDNGRGFPKDAAAAARKPWSLQERVEEAGGTIVLDSRPRNTRISISLPARGPSA